MGTPGDQDDNSGDEEGRELWAYVTRNVEPLSGRDTPGEPDSASKKPGTGRKKLQNDKLDPPAVKRTKAPAKEPASREVDRRTAQRLRRGQMEIEATLDLHGMSRIEAQQALERFLRSAYGQGLRHVLVITGKGARGTGRNAAPGILRQAVPQWLDDQPLRDIVLQFSPARPHHGGAGALYVLLRRKR